MPAAGASAPAPAAETNGSENKFSPEIISRLQSFSEDLVKSRKAQAKPETWLSQVDSLKEVGQTALHTSGLISIDVHADLPDHILTASGDATASLYSISSGTEVLKIKSTEGLCGAKLISSDKAYLSLETGQGQLWQLDIDGKTATLLSENEGHLPIPGTVNPTGEYSVEGTADGWAIYELASDDILLRVDCSDLEDVTAVEFHPDGLMLATGHADGKVVVWDIRAQK